MKNFFLIMTFSMLTLSCSAQGVDNSTVYSLDTDLYLGRWYEIARFDHSFERNVEYATADYTMMDNGMIQVVNQGLKNGKTKTSKGRAKLTDTPGLLRVSFFGPFFSDYRVLMVSENYDYALVGSKTDNYLWILSRTPQLPDDDIIRILDEATYRGYKIDELVWVKQPLLSIR